MVYTKFYCKDLVVSGAIGLFVMPARPWGSSCRRQRDPQGLEGIINGPIVPCNAFFILFHHFIDKIHVYFGVLLLSVYLYSATQSYEPKVSVKVGNKYFITKI